MTDSYLVSLLVTGGICVGFGVHAGSLAMQTRQRRHVYLALLAMLEAAYCLFAWRYLSLVDAGLARVWGQALCVFTPWMTLLFGELTFDLADRRPWERRPRAAVVLQWVTLAFSLAFSSSALFDIAFGTNFVLEPEIRTDLTMLHRHRLVFRPLGQAYLCWITFAFACFTAMLVAASRSRATSMPMVVGCIAYFVATVLDLAIVVGLKDGIYLQHFGFAVLVVGSWRVLSNALSDARMQFERLEEQRDRLLTTPPAPRTTQSMLGTMAAGVAHEINNPVHGIMNYATLLKRQVDPRSAAGGFADEIALASKQVAEIVKSLLQFSRGDSVPTVAADMKRIVDGTLSLMRAGLADDEIVLRVQVDDTLPEITCRAAQLQQVLVNLVTNAREALLARDPARLDEKVINVDVSQFERDDAAWLAVEVSDTGDGFDAVLSEAIFEPFFTTKGPGGMGLGLSISNGIIRAHGGSIQSAAVPGRGARFRIELPCEGGLALPSYLECPGREGEAAVE